MDINGEENVDQPLRPTIGKGERFILLAFAITVDIVQWFLIPTIVVNRFVDIVVGMIILIYGLMRKLMNKQQMTLFIATLLAEEIPGLEGLPFWTFDVYILTKDPNKNGGFLDKAVDFVGNKVGGPKGQVPLNIGGSRKPTGR